MLTGPTFGGKGLQIGLGPGESRCKCPIARLRGRGHRGKRPGIEAHPAVSCLCHNAKQRLTCRPNAIRA